MHIAWIHGFNSSHRSFNYIVGKLPTHTQVAIDYKSHEYLERSIAEVLKQLPKKPLVLVGHSLGGVIATLIAAKDPSRVTKLVTISSPLAGSRAASTMRWLPGSPHVFHDITPSAREIVSLESLKLTIPTLSLFSTGGHLQTSGEPNDSVIAVSSQKALKFGRKQEVKANHFEILQHERTVKALHDFLFEDEDETAV